jgi:hypothetical protein
MSLQVALNNLHRVLVVSLSIQSAKQIRFKLITKKIFAKNATPTFTATCGKSAPVMELAKIQI